MTFQETVSVITPAQGKAFLEGLAPDLNINMRDPLQCLGARLIKHVTGKEVIVGVEAGTVWENQERFLTPDWLAQVISATIDNPTAPSRTTPCALLALIAQQESGSLLQVTILPAPVPAIAVL